MSSSAKRSLKILAAVASADRPLRVSEIARMIEVPPGTAFRGLDALARAQFLSRYQASSRYVIGPVAAQLKQSLLARFRLREVSLPYLRQLASATGEPTSLYLRLGWFAVRIASASGSAEVTSAPLLGEVHFLSEDYPGLAILAFLPADERKSYRAFAAARRLPLPNSAALERKLGAVRAAGHARAAFDDHRAALALPISKPNQVIAALSVEGRLTAADLSTAREVAAAFETLARTQPQLFDTPFDHLDPDDIKLLS